MEMVHAKLVQQVVDFGQLPEAMKGIHADHGYCCLGTTLKAAGSKAQQYVIDHDYVTGFARGCHHAGVTRFSVVSSVGADASSSNFYLRTKGEMERDLRKIPFEGIYILQPSFLMGKRKEFRAGERATLSVMKGINPLMAGPLKKYRGVEVTAVAAMMADKVLHGEVGINIFSSEKIA